MDAKSSKVRVAFFGYGFAGTVMLPCLRHVPGAIAVGISGPNPRKAEEMARRFGIDHASTDHRMILEAARPDLAIVATPPHRHSEMTLDALEAGCHVLCEKPMGLNAGESRSMLDAAGTHPGRLCLIDHELRLLPARAALRRLINGGGLGRILRAEYTLHSSSRRDPAGPWTWWSDISQGGGALGAIGSHAVDTVRSLIGEVAEVSGQLSTYTRRRTDPETGEARAVTSDDAASAWLGLADGAEAWITISLVEAARRHEILVTGSEACARLREQGELEIADSPDNWEMIPVHDSMPASASLGIPDTDWARAFLRLITLVVGRIRPDRGHEEAATLPFGLAPGDLELAAGFEDGHRTQIVLDAIRRSADQRCPIRI